MRLSKHLLAITTVLALLAIATAAQTSSDTQSLGDYAKAVRKQPVSKAQTGKRFDNDNLPADEHISVVGAAPQKETPADSAAKADGAPVDSTEQSTKDADRKAANDDWKKKLQDQKDQIDLNARELDVVQREYRLRAAAMYADAGSRLRNASQWDKEDADYKQKIAEKQKSLDDARQKLEDMQEEARKAGVPPAIRE
jgi:hypothetical protein